VGFASNLLIKGDACAFVMEIPPLRLPQAKNVIKKTVTRMEWYVKEAIPLFLLGTFVLYLLDALHLLQWIQKGMAPIVVNFLGLPVEAANAFLIGFLRRDYGATGFFDMFQHGRLSVVQGLVALTVITLFIPCVANIFMIIKEYGNKVALRVVFFIFPFAFLVGGILHWALK
ncbi:MAG: nucleoside recognition domain-containing protein, partial [Deltaproteobacteria bacterium]|nr:nucleoside recognition domain-containing protein [Deltaproteobacteria bacterium]